MSQDMRPAHMTGDLVVTGKGNMRRLGIVVSVQQSNNVPDALYRGIPSVFAWSYYVFDGRKVIGPLESRFIENVN